MNLLDRQIAEAKGYRVETRGNLTLILPPEDAKPPFKDEPPDWSTSDAKALELVDELAAKGFRFSLRTVEFGRGWIAYFHNSQAFDPLDGGGYTRPEAICRAYLAALEWAKGSNRNL